MADTSRQVRRAPNPTGKGGFKKGQSGNPGGRFKNGESFSYWYWQFKNMTVEQFVKWQQNNPENQRTVAANLAFTRIKNARTDLKEFQEVADRSEGRAQQSVDMTTGGEKLNIALVEFAGSDATDDKKS